MNQKVKILLVDDEQDILEFLSYNFENQGFEVKTAQDGQSAIDIAREFRPQVIILDIMMPVMDGIEACQQLRRSDECNESLIILLTARGEDYSQIAGFDAGADDYLVKPVSVKVLLRKVNVMLRRMQKEESQESQNFDVEGLVIDRDNYLVLRNSREISLPRKEFEILSLMSSKPNRLFRREEIFNHIWGADTYVGERTIDVYIRKLRSKIGDDHIRTIKGVGYKFIPQPRYN